MTVESAVLPLCPSAKAPSIKQSFLLVFSACVRADGRRCKALQAWTKARRESKT